MKKITTLALGLLLPCLCMAQTVSIVGSRFVKPETTMGTTPITVHYEGSTADKDWVGIYKTDQVNITETDGVESVVLRDGDKILAVDGQYIEKFTDIPMQIILEKAKTIEVERNGRDTTIVLPEDALTKLLGKQDANFITYRFPFVVEKVMENSAAEAGGLQAGDVIIGINDIETPYYQDFVKNVKQFRNQDIQVVVLRKTDTLALAMHLPDEGVIGAYTRTYLPDYFEIETKEYTFIQAIPAGFTKTFDGLSDYWKQVKLIFNPKTKAYESVGGFISIGSIFPEQWIWSIFWRMTAFLSIALAVMNILPIPALDGGHILFLLVEIITRRKPSDKFMEVAETVGLIIVLGLVILANGNDIIRLFR